MTVIPSEHRFANVRERRKLKLSFGRPIEHERTDDEPPKDAA